MVLGTYTFWDVMWSMIVFFVWILFVTWVIMLLIDNFRRTDHGGGAKALWALFLIFFPIIGAVTYTIVRPDTAGDYGVERGYGSAPAESTSTASELARLNELRNDGAISDAEFADLKARTIAAS